MAPESAAPRPDSYAAWRQERRAARAGKPVEAGWNHLISVVLFGEGPADLPALLASIESLKAQTYRNVEIIVGCPGSAGALADTDASILRGLFVHPALIAPTFLAAAGSDRLWRGDYALLAPAGTEFEADALALLNAAIARDPAAGLVTCDYDTGKESGLTPHLLCGWDPDLIQSFDYLRHAFLVSRELIAAQRAQAGRPATIHDWLCRLGRCHPQPATTHVAECLLHLPETAAAARAAPAAVPLPARWPSVAIVVPNRNRPDLLARCLDFLAGLRFRPELIVVDNASDDPALPALYAELKAGCGARILAMDGPFNFARMINIGVAASRAEIVLLLNNDVHFSDAGAVEQLVAAAMRPEVGTVGSLLQYPDGTVQHTGILLRRFQGLVPMAGAEHVLRDMPMGMLRTLPAFMAVRNWQAVTGAVMALRRHVFEQVGGFDEISLPVDYNDVDFCLRVRAAGLRVITLPLAGVTHAESSTRGATQRESAVEIYRRASAIMAARWPAAFAADPYRNPWFAGERAAPFLPWNAARQGGSAVRNGAGKRAGQESAPRPVRGRAQRLLRRLLHKRNLGRRLHRRLGLLLMDAPSAAQSPLAASTAERQRPIRQTHRLQPGLCLNGHFLSEIGLGQAVRNIAYACDRQGLAVTLRNIPLEKREHDREFVSKCNPDADRLANLIVNSLASLVCTPAEPGRFNILVPFWELSRIPARWRELARAFDEVWAPSQFIADAFAGDCGRTVRLMPQPIRLPPAPEPARKERDGLRLLTYFDFDSWAARKNPDGVIAAFGAAFGRRRDVELVVKVRGGRDAGMRKILGAAARRDNRIRVIDGTFARSEMDRLMADCDAFVSLHRSEGFGLGAAEALAAGRAAIATDYGGTRDFVSEATGYPVAYRLQQVGPGDYVEAADQVWAEPLLDSAVAALQSIYDDPGEAQARALRGRALLSERNGPAAAGRRIAESLGQQNLL